MSTCAHTESLKQSLQAVHNSQNNLDHIYMQFPPIISEAEKAVAVLVVFT